MTVKVTKPALNLREELAALRNQPKYAQEQFWFDNLVTNGTFDNDTSGWNANRDAILSASGQELTIENAGVNYSNATTALNTVIGKTYQVTFDKTNNTVGAGVFTSPNQDGSGSTSLGIFTSIDSYVLSFTATASTTFLGFYVNSGTSGITASFDNISVFEVDENDDVIHNLPLGFKPVHVYEDGLLQREGTNHDYTVTNTGFGYQIKPTVAPSAATETCVIAEREL